MALINAPRGTADILPSDSHIWQKIEKTLLSISSSFGFSEIRTPVFEHSELFLRSVGETTDIVQKEMYTFDDKGGRSLTLRPEATAGVARAFLEHGLFNNILPLKVSYVSSCFRYEKPQAGRLREFHQFGVECFGASEPQADAEVISLANMILSDIGVTGVSLHINSIGCQSCRKEYLNVLREYFSKHIDKLCETCKDRLERNPMRILDCKSKKCSEISKNAPKNIDHLCDECSTHFDTVKNLLDACETEYVVDTSIVRGLDYYTRTVFEFISDALGSQSTVCGGGRYDGLVEELGGNSTPAIGFGIGLERLIKILEAKEKKISSPKRCELYLASMGEKASAHCFKLANLLRSGGVSVETDIVGRSLKVQMRYANRIGAKYVIVVGDNELKSGVGKLKEMDTGAETETDIDSSLYSVLHQKALDQKNNNMTDLFSQLSSEQNL